MKTLKAFCIGFPKFIWALFRLLITLPLTPVLCIIAILGLITEMGGNDELAKKLFNRVCEFTIYPPLS